MPSLDQVTSIKVVLAHKGYESETRCKKSMRVWRLICDPAILQCAYQINHGTHRPSTVVSWHTIDLIFTRCARIRREKTITPSDRSLNIFIMSTSDDMEELVVSDFERPQAYNFLLETMRVIVSLEAGEAQSMKLIIPKSGGYIVRSDIVPLRCLRCGSVELLESFTDPGQYFPGIASSDLRLDSLPRLFNLAAAGLLLHKTTSHELSVTKQLHDLDKELLNRLSLPWLLPAKHERRTVVMVGGEPKPLTRRDFHNAAKCLGIDIVVIDTPGHWLQDSSYKSWRKKFIPAELELDESLTPTLVSIVKELEEPVHGLITFWDQAMHGTAKAALELGLPTNIPEIYDIATDKYKTSQFAGHPSARASNLEEGLSNIALSGLEYPLIVKPCSGWKSEGVYRVESNEHLAQALAAINTDKHGKDYMLESYIPGPELDLNFVLCDGELLFFDPSDEFPKAGDVSSTTTSGFLECGNIYPPAVPEHELDMLRNEIYALLIKIGARDGVFHLEARIKDSSMEYISEDGICDLQSRKPMSTNQPSAWLIEMHVRPSGLIGTAIVAALYGVEFNGVSLCFAVGDKARAKALSKPFVAGAQCWGEMLMLSNRIGGLWEDDNILEDVIRRRPDLSCYMERPTCWWKRGDRVPDPSKGFNSWAAGCMIFSSESRKHCIMIGEEVRRETQWSLR